MSLITEPPEADCHKSSAGSRHYCTGKHMVSGIFRLNCGTLTKNEGWGHGELTIMRNPEGAAQRRQLPVASNTRNVRTGCRHVIAFCHLTCLLYVVAVTTSSKFSYFGWSTCRPDLLIIPALVALINNIWHMPCPGVGSEKTPVNNCRVSYQADVQQP